MNAFQKMVEAYFVHFFNHTTIHALLSPICNAIMSYNFNYSNQSNSHHNSFAHYTQANRQPFHSSSNQTYNNYYKNGNYPNYSGQNFGRPYYNRNYGYNEGYNGYYNEGYANYMNEGYNNNWNYSSQQPNYNQSFQNSNLFDNSFNSQGEKGFPQVGRFGGAKKKKKQKNNTSFSSNAQSSTSSNGLKVKQPTIKQQSSNEFCFPTHTQTANYVECPFNPNHIMQPNRLLTHISKCKLKSPNAKHYSVCPYDPCHYYSVTQINAHILVCDKRGLFVANDDWNIGALNSSTISSIPNSVESQSIEESTKMPSSILNNEEKILYQQYLIDP